MIACVLNITLKGLKKMGFREGIWLGTWVLGNRVEIRMLKYYFISLNLFCIYTFKLFLQYICGNTCSSSKKKTKTKNPNHKLHLITKPPLKVSTFYWDSFIASCFPIFAQGLSIWKILHHIYTFKSYLGFISG